MLDLRTSGDAKCSRGHSVAVAGEFGWGLLSEVFQGNLNSIVVHLLILGPELLAAVGGAVEKLADLANWRVWLAFEKSGAADVDRAVEIEVVDVLIELAHQ